MTRKPLRSRLTSKMVIGVSAIALLGGGAAMAQDGAGADNSDVTDVDGDGPADDGTDGTDAPSTDLPVDGEATEGDGADGGTNDQDDLVEDDTEIDPGPSAEQRMPAVEEDAEIDGDDDGEGWALGRRDGAAQLARVEAFCEAREADDEGVPPFCSVDGGPVAPNDFGQRVAEQARAGGPPEHAGGPPDHAGRPDHAGSSDETSDGLTEEETPVEPATDAVAPAAGTPGPPPHAVARGRNG